MINKVPFPAYETFEDRQNVPRRYYLFFEKILKPGRHNKELWNAAITRRNGRNNIPFSSSIFEAHVLTTVRENYFTWIYQALANPNVVPMIQQAVNFKVEYDYDVLPEMLACNSPLISDLPLTAEYKYNEETKVFDTLLLNDIDEVEIQQSGEDEVVETIKHNVIYIEERKRLQTLIDVNKENHRKTLHLLREKVDRVRPGFCNLTREQKNEFNINAKRSFRMFMEEHHEITSAPPSAKKAKKPSPNKCRIPKEKLDVLKRVNNVILLEKASGLRRAWEKFYKMTVNKHLQNEARKYKENHRASDFLGELDDLEVNWKNSNGPATPETEHLSDEDDMSDSDMESQRIVNRAEI